MSTWAAIATGAIVSVASVVVGVLLQWRISETQRERDRDEARLQRVAAVLGQIRSHLTDLQPKFVVFSTLEKVREFYADHWRRLQADLNVLIATEPPGELREALRQLDDSIGSLFVSLSQVVSPELRQLATEAGETRNFYEVAEERYAEADRLSREIIDDLHGKSEVGTGVGKTV